MQDKELNKLIEYLQDMPCLSSVKYVEKREFGADDLLNSAYVRPDDDRGTDNYRSEDKLLVGSYVLVADVTDLDDACLSIKNKLLSFSGAIVTWQTAGTISDVIYENETGEPLQDNCKYVMIRFEMKTPDLCLYC